VLVSIASNLRQGINNILKENRYNQNPRQKDHNIRTERGKREKFTFDEFIILKIQKKASAL